MSEQELKALRLRIDSLDEKVLELISERARCAQEVARVKMASLAEGEVPVFYRPEREAQVLKRVMERNKGRWATKRWRGCSAKSCRRAWPSSSR
jgi:chorismate mutase/prephenate dehydratase